MLTAAVQVATRSVGANIVQRHTNLHWLATVMGALATLLFGAIFIGVLMAWERERKRTERLQAQLDEASRRSGRD